MSKEASEGHPLAVSVVNSVTEVTSRSAAGWMFRMVMSMSPLASSVVMMLKLPSGCDERIETAESDASVMAAGAIETVVPLSKVWSPRPRCSAVPAGNSSAQPVSQKDPSTMNTSRQVCRRSLCNAAFSGGAD